MKKYLSLVVVFMSMNAQAEITYSPTYEACTNTAQGVTNITISCINAEFKQQDKQLNKQYQSLKNSLEPSRQQELIALQRLWIKFKDAQCKFYADPKGGSLHRMLANQCVLDMTVTRSRELRELELIFAQDSY